MIDYGEAWDLQLKLVEARHRGEVPDLVLLLEHPPVFTLGRRGGRGHLRVPEPFLAERGVPVVHVERGGEVTYHGPGQLVGYPIVDLRANGWKVVDFVGALEEIMLGVAADFGVRAGRNALNRGVWVGMEKLGSVGIAVRRGVSFHGFALNVNTDLTPFGWINPCGLRGIGMTSLARCLGKSLCMDHVRASAKRHLQGVFNLRLEALSLEALSGLLQQAEAPRSDEVRPPKAPSGIPPRPMP
jgi:lipoate-protein ligase B